MASFTSMILEMELVNDLVAFQPGHIQGWSKGKGFEATFSLQRLHMLSYAINMLGISEGDIFDIVKVLWRLPKL